MTHVEENVEEISNQAIPTQEEIELPDLSINDSDCKLEKLKGRKKSNVHSPRQDGEEEIDLHLEFEKFLNEKTSLIQDAERIFIPTGIDLLDTILGGGITVGTMTMIAGTPGAGKSMLAAQIAANAQKSYKDLLLIYLDSEEVTTQQRLISLGVVNPPIKPRNNVTLEDFFRAIEVLCLFKEKTNTIEIPSMVILDSLANTQTQKEREIDDPNAIIGYRARLLSCILPKYISKINKYKISVIVVNQLRDQLKMGQFAPRADLKFVSSHKVIPGGNSVHYNSSLTLEMYVKSSLDDKFPFSGINVAVKAVKNKNFAPNIPIELIGDFVSGFSNFWTNYKLLVDFGRIKTGAWNFLQVLPSKKFRTKDAEKILHEDEEFKEVFQKETSSVLEHIRKKYQAQSFHGIQSSPEVVEGGGKEEEEAI